MLVVPLTFSIVVDGLSPRLPRPIELVQQDVSCSRAINYIAYGAKLCFLAISRQSPGCSRTQARAEHDSYRGEAATGHEEIFEIEPRLPAETRAPQSSHF